MQHGNLGKGDKLGKRIIYPNYDEYEGEVLNNNLNKSVVAGEKTSLFKNSPDCEKSLSL